MSSKSSSTQSRSGRRPDGVPNSAFFADKEKPFSSYNQDNVRVEVSVEGGERKCKSTYMHAYSPIPIYNFVFLCIIISAVERSNGDHVHPQRKPQMIQPASSSSAAVNSHTHKDERYSVQQISSFNKNMRSVISALYTHGTIKKQIDLDFNSLANITDAQYNTFTRLTIRCMDNAQLEMFNKCIAPHCPWVNINIYTNTHTHTREKHTKNICLFLFFVFFLCVET